MEYLVEIHQITILSEIVPYQNPAILQGFSVMYVILYNVYMLQNGRSLGQVQKENSRLKKAKGGA